MISDSVCNLVESIFEDLSKVQAINDTNIALIPKVDHPESLQEFRPISLCNVSYKVVTKIISRRHKMVGNH